MPFPFGRYPSALPPLLPVAIIATIAAARRQHRENTHLVAATRREISAGSFGSFYSEDTNLQCLNGAHNSLV